MIITRASRLPSNEINASWSFGVELPNSRNFYQMLGELLRCSLEVRFTKQRCGLWEELIGRAGRTGVFLSGRWLLATQ